MKIKHVVIQQSQYGDFVRYFDFVDAWVTLEEEKSDESDS